MPLIFKAFQSNLPTKDKEFLFYPTLVKHSKVVDTGYMADKIAEKSSLTPGDVRNVINNLMTVMRESLLNSQTVKLDGLGSFTMRIKANGKGVAKEEDVSASQITSLYCRFTPEGRRSAGVGTTRALYEGASYINIKSLTGEKNDVTIDENTDTPSGGNTGGGGGALG